MTKYFPLVFILLMIEPGFGQTERPILTGTVTDGKNPIFNVHVVNETTQRGSISDKNGGFRIRARENDIIHFTDIQFKPRLIKVTEHHLEEGMLIVLKSKTTELEEVIVETKNMAEEHGLPNAGKEPLTPLERRINYIQKGGIIDKLYAMISGEKKKLKKLQELYEADRKEVDIQLDIQMIRNHFEDAFFIKTIGITKDRIDAFIRFCLPQKLMFYYYRDREVDMIDVFIKQKPFFPDKDNRNKISQKPGTD